MRKRRDATPRGICIRGGTAGTAGGTGRGCSNKRVRDIEFYCYFAGEISRLLLDRARRRATTLRSHQTNAIVQNEYISLVVNGAS